MKTKTIVTLFNDLKQSAIDSGLTEEVVLVKSQEEIPDMLLDKNYRVLFVVADIASIYTEDDDITFQLTVADKTNFDDDSFLYSINDNVSLLKVISDKLNYKMNNYVVVGNIQIGSGTLGDELMVTASCAMSFFITYLPNIHSGD